MRMCLRSLNLLIGLSERVLPLCGASQVRTSSCRLCIWLFCSEYCAAKRTKVRRNLLQFRYQLRWFSKGVCAHAHLRP